jgi:RNA polymerase sigma factor (sigma-70 family)
MDIRFFLCSMHESTSGGNLSRMSPTILHTLVRLARSLAGKGPLGDMDDMALLASFAAARDEAAFAALLERHGRLVWGVCRALLRNDADAEDAFQATFVALFRGAARIRQPRSLAPWLHSTATRIAQKARLAAARRHHREHQAARPEAAPPTVSEGPWEALDLAVHDEITRLPAALRLAFVLCVLEGHRHQDAAAQLGVPVGTISARVSRARKKLMDRLSARGLAPVLAAPAVACAAATVSASVPQALLLFVHRQLADGFSSVSKTILDLATPMAGGLSMTGKWLSAAVLMTATLIATIGGVWYVNAQPKATAPPGPAAGKDTSPPAAPAKQPRGDQANRNGGPLPAGALFRFGSLRGRHDGTIRASALSPDGKRLATSSGQSVVLWDVATNEPLRRFDIDGYWPFSRPTLVFSPDGRRLGYVHSNSFGCVWDVKSGKEVARFERKRLEESHYHGLCHFTPDSKEIVVGEGPKKLVFWDLQANRPKRTVAVEHVSFLSPDARTGARINLDGAKFSLVFSDTQTGKKTGTWDTVSVNAGGAFAPDGKSIALVHRRKDVQVRDFPAGRLRFSVPLPGSARYKVGGQEYCEYRVRFSTDGKTLLLATHGGLAHRWDLATGKELPPLKRHVGPVTGIHLLPDRKTVITTGEEGLIRRWDARSGKELSAPEGYAGSLHSDYSPNGRFVAVGDGRGRLELWSARQGRRLLVLQADGPAVTRVVFRPDGKVLAAALADSTVHFWSVPAGKEQRVLRCGKEQDLSYTRVMQFSPDGRRLLLSDHNSRACVWDLAGQKICWAAPFALCAFSPDGATVVGEHRGWHFRDAKTGKPCGKLALGERGFGGFRALAYSPDGQRIAAGHHDGTVHLCLPTASGPVPQFKAVEEPRAMKDPILGALDGAKRQGAPVYALTFSRDGRWLCTTGLDGSLRLWEVATLSEVLRLPGHAVHIGGRHGVAFGADSRTVLSSGPDAQAYLWSLRPAAAPTDKSSLDALWAALADKPKKAYRAIWQLSDARGAAKFLQGKIPPVKPVADKHLDKLIADLNSDEFAVREAAGRALTDLGELAVPAMRKALASRPPLEPRLRLEALVKRVETRTLTTEELRIQRAIAALEMQGTAEAREVLKRLAAGAPGALTTTAAQSALRRAQ